MHSHHRSAETSFFSFVSFAAETVNENDIKKSMLDRILLFHRIYCASLFDDNEKLQSKKDMYFDLPQVINNK